MDRRQFVAGAGAGVAASAFPMPAIAQGVRELKMVTIWPKGWPGLQSGADRVAQSITALSGGRLPSDPAIQIRKGDETILQELGKISGEVLSKASRKDELARQVYESFITFRRRPFAGATFRNARLSMHACCPIPLADDESLARAFLRLRRGHEFGEV